MSQPALQESHAQSSSPANRHPVGESIRSDAGEHEGPHSLDWIEIGRVAFVAVAATSVWFLRGSAIPHLDWIGAICAVAGGYPIYHEAYENIVERRMTMELSMAIAIVAALAIRETFTALVITASELAFILNSTRLIPSGRVMRDRLLARDA